MTFQIAVLGTGIMGSPIARLLADAQYPVTVWNRTRAKAEPLADHNIRVCSSAAAAVSGARVVITMLSDGPAIEAVMCEECDALRALEEGSVWAQMSTVGVAWTQRFADAARQAGVRFVDAPVVGSRQAAEDGELTILAASPGVPPEIVQPVFDIIGDRTIWLDGADSATRLALVIDSWMVGMVGILAESLALAEGLELDARLFLDVLSGTALDAPFAHAKGAAMLSGDYPPAFPLAHARKECGLIQSAAAAARLRVPINEAIGARFDEAIAAGLGGADMAAVIEAARSRTA